MVELYAVNVMVVGSTPTQISKSSNNWLTSCNWITHLSAKQTFTGSSPVV
jgi:hypothetical protein